MKIALLGYGKMGKTIERLALHKGHEIVFKKSRTTSEGDLKLADVAIDFSIPETAFGNIKGALEQDIPVVSGTTGWLDHYDEIIKFCHSRNGSFIYASNFSVGVQLFFHLNEHLAHLMQPWQDYSPEITEIHHTQKLDAPSGTAITIAEGILKHSTKNRWELDSENPSAVSIKAKREGEVKGTHIVTYTSAIDTLQISHEAHTREGFAQGAIIAAEWLQQKKGVYSMKDVLGLKK